MSRVLDASTLLMVLFREPGHEAVAPLLDGAVTSAVNVAELAGKLVDRQADVRPLVGRLSAAGVTVQPFTTEDAVMAGVLRGLDGGRRLSLGDRCCLALALREPGSEVLTADRAWAGLDLPITVTLVR